jgi:hypothetical protein
MEAIYNDAPGWDIHNYALRMPTSRPHRERWICNWDARGPVAMIHSPGACRHLEAYHLVPEADLPEGWTELRYPAVRDYLRAEQGKATRRLGIPPRRFGFCRCCVYRV